MGQALPEYLLILSMTLALAVACLKPVRRGLPAMEDRAAAYFFFPAP